MTYINHLNKFLSIARKDRRLNCSHFSMYIALFYVWNGHRFTNPFPVNREELMAISHIGSKSTYTKTLDDLHQFGYIRHEKPRSKFWKSRVTMARFSLAENETQLNLFETNGVDNGKTIASKELRTVPHLDRLHGSKSGHLTVQNQDAIRPKNGTPTVPIVGRSINKDIKEVLKRETDSAPTPKTPPKKMKEKNSQEISAGGQKCYAFAVVKMMPAKTGERGQKDSNATFLNRQSCLPYRMPQQHRPSANPTMGVDNASIPTLEQVKGYFEKQTRQLSWPLTTNQEGIKFFSHYTAIGWKLGGTNPIIDWQAAADKWLLNCWHINQHLQPSPDKQNPLQTPPPGPTDYSAPL